MSVEPVDLTNCDREPIHIPGSIQPHGCMIVCDVNASEVLRHSANAPAMLGLASDINGQRLEALLGEVVHTLRNALAASQDPARASLIFGLVLPAGGVFDVAIHRFKSTAIIEFEPTQAKAEQPLELARSMVGRIRDIHDVDRLLQHTARLVRGVLGYDRVMIYRFAHDGAGQVVSEAKRSDLESFQGQWFPATDIPQQARTLYLRNTIRIISDASFQPIPIVPDLDASGEPLDLSFAHLRSVSPIHCEYLRNMGVAASMSISVIIDGALWGLIACHHYSPRTLAMSQRVAAEMFGEFFSLHLHALKQKRSLNNSLLARRALDRFLRIASHHADMGELLGESLPEFADLMPCDGVGLWLDGKWSAHGETVPASAVPALARLISTVSDGKIWATHALSQRMSEAEDFPQSASGVLAIPLSQLPKDYLLFFRKEVEQTLNWAGRPDKIYETGPLGDRLTPRKSFAIWKETVRMQAAPWTDADREIAEAARSALVEIVLRHSELMADERSKADIRQRMLNEELNHRVKNILAVIKSLVGHPVQDGRTLSDYVSSLRGRIQALATAHDQVVRGDGGGLIIDLMSAELSPYRGTDAAVSLNGPEIWLDARAFSVMALVLHELSTNAAKYGALSRSGGHVDVRWGLTPDGNCEVVWRESGGPPVTPPTRNGFGTALIDRSVPYDLGGESDVNYLPTGVIARFLLPARHLSTSAMKAEESESDSKQASNAAPNTMISANLDLLLVEDQMLIAMDVESMLADNGITKVVTAASSADALRRLKDYSPDIAVLDINLGMTTSAPVAEELMRRNIPFVFATGYGDRSMIPEACRDVPVLPKPYEADALMAAIQNLLAKSQVAS